MYKPSKVKICFLTKVFLANNMHLIILAQMWQKISSVNISIIQHNLVILQIASKM